MIRIRLCAWQLALLASVFIIAVNNNRLFASLFATLELTSWQGGAYFALLMILMSGIVFALLLLTGIGRLMKPMIVVFLLLSAVIAYFTNEMGVVIDLDMIRNIVATAADANAQEAMELLSWPLLLHVVLFAVMPAALMLLVDVREVSPFIELRQRAICLVCGCFLLAALGLPNYKYLTYFSIEHRDLRFEVIPDFALLSLVKYVKRAGKNNDQRFQVVGGDATQQKSARARVVGVLVVGETARSDHFSLHGYRLHTNPRLENEAGIAYFDAAACGTSTAYSVPCMFSMRGQDTYTPQLARHESNVLDMLTRAGVHTVWIDNNSSCKGVCSRIESNNLRLHPDSASPLYSDGGYYDGILLENLEQYLTGSDRESQDLLLVLHTLGSHGPAYSRRYPEAFGIFKPFCDKKSPKECTDTEVSNAYDNTIVYTDYILSRVIGLLKQHDDEFESFMMYVSDHGESLGENGVYLHGLPYVLAPDAQTKVPLILWLSTNYGDAHGIFSGAPTMQVDGGLSHDNISHTLLGLFEVRTREYRRDKDILAGNSVMFSKR